MADNLAQLRWPHLPQQWVLWSRCGDTHGQGRTIHLHPILNRSQLQPYTVVSAGYLAKIAMAFAMATLTVFLFWPDQKKAPPAIHSHPAPAETKLLISKQGNEKPTVRQSEEITNKSSGTQETNDAQKIAQIKYQSNMEAGFSEQAARSIAENHLNTVSYNDLPTELREQYQKEDAEYARLGYVEMDQENMDGYHNRYAELVTTDPHDARIKPKLIDLSGSALGSMQFDGISIDIQDEKNWIRVRRVFERGTVSLSELDYKASDIHITTPKETFNREISGYPGTIKYYQATNGKGVTLLTWTTATKDFELSFLENVIGTPEETKMLAIAAAITPRDSAATNPSN
jgi:hypothetical protein